MTYQLVQRYSPDALAAEVNFLISEGWLPHGGPYAVPEKSAGSATIYYLHIQAMVRAG